MRASLTRFDCPWGGCKGTQLFVLRSDVQSSWPVFFRPCRYGRARTNLCGMCVIYALLTAPIGATPFFCADRAIRATVLIREKALNPEVLQQCKAFGSDQSFSPIQSLSLSFGSLRAFFPVTNCGSQQAIEHNCSLKPVLEAKCRVMKRIKA